MTTGLILAGHGSHISPATAGLIWRHVDRLRALNVADEVTAAFWKEAPSFHEVLKTMTATDITIVPLFTAEGFFTQRVIPAEMSLTGRVTGRDGRTIRYARTLSGNPYLAEIVRQRIADAQQRAGARPDQVAIAIIGHSTRLDTESRKATEAQAELTRQSGAAAEVVAVFLDDSPGIQEVYRLTAAPYLIAVPYFLAAGSHTMIDVLECLGLEAGQATGLIKGRRVYYTPPVGVEDTLTEVILERAREAGTPLRPARPGSAWDGFPVAGCAELISAVHEAGALHFGQLELTCAQVQRADDAGHAQVITDPGELRAIVREDSFRPLATSTDLPGGWIVPIADPAMLHGVVETIYPGAVADWATAQRGEFAANRFEAVIERQIGQFRELAGAAQAKTVQQVCGCCVRHPTWFDDTLEQIPCAEPCNRWLSVALKSIGEHD